jgi:hypothetical protein
MEHWGVMADSALKEIFSSGKEVDGMVFPFDVVSKQANNFSYGETMSTTAQQANWSFDLATDTDPIARNKIDPLAFRKQLIYVGNHVKGADDQFQIDEPLIDHWVDTGNDMINSGIEIPMPKKHNEDDPELNRGFVNKFAKATDSKGRTSLFVFGKFADEESAKLGKRSNVSLFSPMQKAIAGKVYQRPITHVAFTNYPVVKGLEAFTSLSLSYDEPQECPECAKRKAGKTFSLDETTLIDNAGLLLAAENGKAYAAMRGDEVLVCSNVPDDYEAFFTYELSEKKN